MSDHIAIRDILAEIERLHCKTPQSEQAQNQCQALEPECNITDRKNKEESLRELHQRDTRILESITDAFFALDGQWRFTYVNQHAEQLLQRSRNELLGRNIWNEFPETKGSTFQQAYQQAVATRTAVHFEEYYPILKAWFEVHAYPSQDGLAVYFRDVSSRRRAAEELQRRHRELAALNTITTAVSGSLELAHLLNTLQTLMIEQLEITSGAVFFYEEATGCFKQQAAWGLPADVLAEFKTFPAVDLPSNQTLQEPDAPWELNWHRVKPFAALGDRARQLGWCDFLCVPLLANSAPQGVLCLFGKIFSTFATDRMTFFHMLGRQVGVAIQNARLFEQVSASRSRLQAVSYRLVQVQEAERRRIACELHDEIGQALTGLKLSLEMLARLPVDRIHEHLDQTQRQLNGLMTQVRNLSLDLRPAMLDDLGLVPAFLWLFQRYQAQTGVQVTFEHSGLEERFHPEVETASYRIVQEALTNVARHAGVREATVRLWLDSDHLCIQVEDQGVGFDTATAFAKGTSSGLSGMQERAVLLEGCLEIESYPSGGTRLLAALPLYNPAERNRDGADLVAGG